MNPADAKHFFKDGRNQLICLLLVVATFAVYGQVAGFEFTNYDEFLMILKNPMVSAGLTFQGFVWALKSSWFEYWHPVTWLSHMLDCELFGLNAGWHHLVSAGFHAANALLVFALFQRLTGARERSAIVAALFALHPLHVESVAWIAERKDVLCAFFFFLAIWAYASFALAKSKGEGQVLSDGSRQEALDTRRPALDYRLALLFFALGLMTKPMVVTLPFVLLLLDVWPLQRIEPDPRKWNAKMFLPLLKEKLPFFGLSLASSAYTYWSVKSENNIFSAAEVPWSFRLTNVPVSYARYLWKMV